MIDNSSKIIAETGAIANPFLQGSKVYISKVKTLFILNLGGIKQITILIKQYNTPPFMVYTVTMNKKEIGYLHNPIHSIEFNDIKNEYGCLHFNLVFIVYKQESVVRRYDTNMYVEAQYKVFMKPDCIELYHNMWFDQPVALVDDKSQNLTVKYPKDFVKHSKELLLSVMKDNIR